MAKTIDAEMAIDVILANGVGENMAVDGSVTPVIFTPAIPIGKKWRMVRASLYLEGANAFSSEKFGDLTELANGIEFKFAGASKGIWKTNRDIVKSIHRTEAPTSLGKTDRSMVGEWSMPIAYGAEILLDGDANDVEVIISDDLSTLTHLSFRLQGHLI